MFITRKIFLKRGIPHSVPGQGIRRDIMRSRPVILRWMRDSLRLRRDILRMIGDILRLSRDILRLRRDILL